MGLEGILCVTVLIVSVLWTVKETVLLSCFGLSGARGDKVL
jgi:hypothetical protein